MPLQVTYNSYWNQVEKLVKDTLVESKAIDCDFSDLLLANVSNHEFTIYTGNSYLVLFHSQNEEYYHDNLGFEFERNSSFDEKIRIIACYAMWADCIEFASRQDLI